MTALLSARAVGFSFGAKTVLENASLALEPGAFSVVVGPNGSGKTTLLRLLSGVLRPASGAVELRGRAIARFSRREVARALAVVPQEIRVPFSFSVRELVAMGRAPHLGALGREAAADTARVDEALAALGLQSFAARSFATLSGGEKQRVLLARALAQEADLLLLDEPTAHMDLGHRYRTLEWLGEWLGRAVERRAVLLVTHDLVLAARFADRLWLLERGRVAASGAPEDVLTSERIARVYGVEARVRVGPGGVLEITPERSRAGSGFGYPPGRT